MSRYVDRSTTGGGPPRPNFLLLRKWYDLTVDPASDLNRFIQQFFYHEKDALKKGEYHRRSYAEIVKFVTYAPLHIPEELLEAELNEAQAAELDELLVTALYDFARRVGLSIFAERTLEKKYYLRKSSTQGVSNQEDLYQASFLRLTRHFATHSREVKDNLDAFFTTVISSCSIDDFRKHSVKEKEPTKREGDAADKEAKVHDAEEQEPAEDEGDVANKNPRKRVPVNVEYINIAGSQDVEDIHALDQISQILDRNHIEALIERISDSDDKDGKKRRYFKFYYLDGMTPQEIAESEGDTATNVRAVLSRGRWNIMFVYTPEELDTYLYAYPHHRRSLHKLIGMLPGWQPQECHLVRMYIDGASLQTIGVAARGLYNLHDEQVQKILKKRKQLFQTFLNTKDIVDTMRNESDKETE